MIIINRQITQAQFDTLRAQMSILAPLAKVTYVDGRARLDAENVAVLGSAEDIAKDILCDLLEPVKEITYTRPKVIKAMQTKRLRQSGVQVYRGVGR